VTGEWVSECVKGVGGMIMTGDTEVIGVENVPEPYISRGLARDWIQASVVRGWWLFVWARPSWLLPRGRDWRGDNLRSALLGAACAVFRSVSMQVRVFCYMTPWRLVCRCHSSADALRLIFRVIQKPILGVSIKFVSFYYYTPFMVHGWNTSLEH